MRFRLELQQDIHCLSILSHSTSRNIDTITFEDIRYFLVTQRLLAILFGDEPLDLALDRLTREVAIIPPELNY